MSPSDDAAAWDDLVRRLEAMGSDEDAAPDDAPGPGAGAQPPAGDRADRDPAARPPGAGPRAVAGFDFQVDPAVLGPSRSSAPAGGQGPRDWSAAEDPNEGAFEPPEPEPLLAGRPDRVVAWIAAVGLPLLMIALTVFWAGSTPPLLWPVLLIGALGAWTYLFWRLPRERADDGDDGARL